MKEEEMKQTNLVPLKSFKRYPLDEMQKRADEFYRDLDRRRTIRDFTDDPVTRNVIENCLKAADTAPSGANQHPWHFVVVEDQEIKSEIRKLAEEEEREFYEKRANIWHKKFHHTFKENIDMKSVGFGEINRFCTNEYGFKSKCNIEKKNSFNFGFLGDSFTEGIGLNHKDTFVGIFENISGLDVANMGVSSYSPKVHLAKINFFLSKNLKFEHVILFLDISDYYDEAYYQFDGDKYSVMHNKRDQRRIWLRENFPLTNFYMYVLKKIEKKNEKKDNKTTETIFNESANRKTFWLNKNINETKINGKPVITIHEETKNYIDQIYKILEYLITY